MRVTEHLFGALVAVLVRKQKAELVWMIVVYAGFLQRINEEEKKSRQIYGSRKAAQSFVGTMTSNNAAADNQGMGRGTKLKAKRKCRCILV